MAYPCKFLWKTSKLVIAHVHTCHAAAHGEHNLPHRANTTCHAATQGEHNQQTRDAQMYILNQNVDFALTLAMGTFTENPYARMKIL